MTDFMLTVVGGLGARDVRVNDADDIREAIGIAERATGCRVSHGRGIRGDNAAKFDPAVICEGGQVYQLHDRVAKESMQIIWGKGRGVFVRKGEGER